MRRGVFIVLASCGRIGFDPAGTSDARLDSTSPDAQVTCGAWQAPSPLIFANTVNDDWEPTVAPNGGPIVFASTRNGGINELFITPQTPTGPTQVVAITALNTGMNMWGPQWNATGTRLYFARDASNTGELLFSSVFDGTNFAAPQVEGGFDGTDPIVGLTVSSDELELVYSDFNNGQISRLGHAKRATIGDAWIKTGHLDSLDSGMGDGYASLSRDGLTIVWESHRDGAGRIYTATRATLASEFANVAPFDGIPVVTGFDDGDPDLTGGLEVFAFASTRPGSIGANDVWLAHRVCSR